MPNPLVPFSEETPSQEESTPTVTEPTKVFNPEGEPYTIAAGYPIPSGWRKASSEEISKEQVINEKVQEAEKAPDSFINRIVDRIAETSGLKDIAEATDTKKLNEWLAKIGEPPIPVDSPQAKAVMEEVRKRQMELHPTETTVGHVAGYGTMVAGGEALGFGKAGEAASAAVRGGEEVASLATRAGEESFAKGAEVSLARKVLAGAAKVAAESTLYSSPQIALRMSQGDYEGAAETAAWSIGIGSILGGAGAAVGAGLGAATKALTKAGGEFAIGKLDKLSEIQGTGPAASEAAAKFGQEVFQKFPEIMNHAESLPVAKSLYQTMIEGGSEPSYSKFQELKNKVASLTEDAEPKTPKAALGEMAGAIMDNIENNHLQQVINDGRLPGSLIGPASEWMAQKTIKEGAALGGAVAGATVGHPIVGMMAAKYVVKKFLSDESGLNVIAPYLKKVMTDSNAGVILGGLLTKEGQSALQRHIESIPEILTSNRIVSATIASTNPVQHLLGNTVGLTKDQQYDKLVKAINQATVDTGMTAHKMGQTASVFAGTDTSLAGLIAQKQYGALSYLQSQIPKNPNAAKPFQKDDWKPTKNQQQEFLDKVAVVNNPMVVWQKYQKGILTANDRDALKAVYPNIYNQMVNKVLTAAYDPRGPKLNSDQRMKLSMFTGMPLDESLKNIGAIQQAVSTPQQPSGPSAQPQPKRSSRTREPKFEHTPSLQTEVQRRTYNTRKD